MASRFGGADGVSDFDKLHSRAHDNQLFLCAFDLLEIDGVDYGREHLAIRMTRLRNLLARTDGMRFSERLETAQTISSTSARGGSKASHRSAGISQCLGPADAKRRGCLDRIAIIGMQHPRRVPYRMLGVVQARTQTFSIWPHNKGTRKGVPSATATTTKVNISIMAISP